MKAAGVTIADSQTAQWEMDQANRIASAMLGEHPRIKALLCCNDSMALGALAAVKSAGRAGEVLIVGFDNIAAIRSAIKDGSVLATADQHADQLAVYGIELALKLLKGERPPRRHHHPGRPDHGGFARIRVLPAPPPLILKRGVPPARWGGSPDPARGRPKVSRSTRTRRTKSPPLSSSAAVDPQSRRRPGPPARGSRRPAGFPPVRPSRAARTPPPSPRPRRPRPRARRPLAPDATGSLRPD